MRENLADRGERQPVGVSGQDIDRRGQDSEETTRSQDWHTTSNLSFVHKFLEV